MEGKDQARETAKHVYYNLIEVPGFEALKERVVIEWEKNFARVVPWLDTKLPKKVLEIQEKPFSQPFKPFRGYLDFTLDFGELQQLKRQGPQDEWRLMLSAVYGVYLILDKSDGQQYIGAAYGEQGVWQRWIEYADTAGSGGNKALEERVGVDINHARHFQFTLLMTWPRTANYIGEVLKWEKLFKLKIGAKLCRN